MNYSLSFPNPLTHMIHVRAEFLVEPHAHCTFHLPMWRPGRYEAANYAKNLRGLRFSTAQGRPLEATKPRLSTWRVTADSTGKIVAEYEYFAFRMDAGSSWIDEELIYINFVNCLLYEPLQMENPCNLHIDIPAEYRVATSLSHENSGHFTSRDYYELADSPLLAAKDLQELTYSAGNTSFHIWSWGRALKPDTVVDHFHKFSEEQINMMHEFPETSYHFLMLFLPYKFYHGVEHAASTVICLGPAEKIEEEEMMDQLLGVSSHELFHAWNILKIRPRELFPYKYHEPAYFPTGFVAEGFTTYYGDLFLLRADVRDRKWYLNELSRLLKRHFDNHGRLSLSVVDSSYDLWIDGYQKSAPGRKSSIYVEGAVAALMLDLTIRESSNGERSLDDVVRTLFIDFAQRRKGYTLEDIRTLASDAASADLNDFFDRFILGTEEKMTTIGNLLRAFGLTLSFKLSPFSHERYLGIRLMENEGSWRINQIFPGSPGESYFSLEDEILSIDQVPFKPDLFGPKTNEEIIVRVRRMHRDKDIHLIPDVSNSYFEIPEVNVSENASEAEIHRLNQWFSPSTPKE